MMENYYLFVLMSIMLVILPGPDTGLVTQNTIARGKKAGYQTALGSTSGVLIHTVAAVAGLSAIIVKSSFLFSAFKYIGALYLIYLGLSSLWAMRKKEDAGDNKANAKEKRHISSFRQGFLSNVLNPKVAVFFLTFLPQFINSEHHIFIQLLLMGLTYGVLTFIWFMLYVYLINAISVWMRKPSIQRSIQGVSGLVLLGFGIKLAFEKRP